MSLIPILNFRLNGTVTRRLVYVRRNECIVVVDCDFLFDGAPHTRAAASGEVAGATAADVCVRLVGDVASDAKEEFCTNFALRVILCPDSVVRLAVANSNLLRRIRQILAGPISGPTDEGIAIPAESTLLKRGERHSIIAILHLRGGLGEAIPLPAVRVKGDGDLGDLDVNAEDYSAVTQDFSVAGGNRGDRLIRPLFREDIPIFIGGHRCHLAVGRRPAMVVPPVVIRTTYGYLTTDIQGLGRSTRSLGIRSGNRRNLDVGSLDNLVGRNGINAILAGNLGGLVGIRHGDALELVVLGRLDGQGKVLVSRDLNVLGLGDLLLLALGVGQSDGAVLDVDRQSRNAISLPRGVIGSRLVRGGNLRGLDGDRQAVVHGLGGNRVRAGLVGVHIGVHTVDGVEHAARLEAVVGGHGELDLGLGREIDRILVLGDRLLGAVRVGVLERRVRDLDRYLSGGVLLDRGGVILGRSPLREVVLVALGPSGLVGLLVVRGLRVGRGVRGGVRGRIRRIIPLVHRGVGPLGGGPLRGGRLVLGVHRAVLDDLLLSIGRDAELLSDRRDVHGGDGHRCDEHAHQRTLGTHAMLFREVPAFFPKVLP